MSKKIDMILYKMLLDQKIVEKEVLDGVVKKSGSSSGAAWIAELSADGVINETAVLELLANRLGLQFRELGEGDVDESLFREIHVKIASHYQFLPVRLDHNILTVAVYYPLDINAEDEIRFQVGRDINQIVAVKKNVIELLQKYYGLGAETIEKMFLKDAPDSAAEDSAASREELLDIQKSQEDATVSNLVNEIIFDAYKKRATDIHIEPYRGQVRFRYRIDGILYDANVSVSVRHYVAPILSRIKIMSNLDIVEHRMPQDGQAVVKVGDQRLDLRVSFIPTPFGESVVIRILPTVVLYDVDKLGLAEEDKALLEKLLARPNGIIFVTGPTGSGKTTTLYACLNRLNTDDVKIITIEDPIEYEMPGMTQIQVNPQIGLTFAAGLRSMLRHDPDVIMVGEVRDLETAEIAIRVALTGHLVFSTLHTNSAASSVHRLMDIGIEPYLIHSSTIAFIAQRLVRVLCPYCKAEMDEQKDAVENYLKDSLDLDPTVPLKIYKGVGCEKCNKTGYYGRTAIYEMLHVTEEVKELIQKRASADEIERCAKSQGMKTLLESGLRKIADGVTSVDEIVNILPAGGFSLEAYTKGEGAAAPEAGYSDRKIKDDERRVYARMSRNFPVVFSVYKGPGRDGKAEASALGISESDFWNEHSVITENISSGGLVFRNAFPLPAGAILNMTVDIPIVPGKPSKVVHCTVRVIRVDNRGEDRYDVAVCFLDMSSRDRTELNSFIESIKAREEDA